jgi:hypothetical protein
MANRYWFKPKTYGYGVTPVSWEGWLSALAYSAVMLACVLIVAFDSQNLIKAALCLGVFVFVTIGMFQIARPRIDTNGIGTRASVSNDWKN